MTSGKHPSRDPGELSKARYTELRRLARAYISREPPGQTLQGTALVHEAYLRLLRSKPVWTGERHFVAIMALAMKQILVERARARGAQKRGAGMDRVTWSDTLFRAAEEDAMLPALDDALSRLEQMDPELARIVELRYFVGLSIEDTAHAVGLSTATVKRRWALARRWLFRELKNR